MAAVARRTAALYFRQSLDVQEGMDRQRARCSALAEAKGFEIVGEYADNDTSASKARGVGTSWYRLLADARLKKFDVVIAVDLDRLLRTISDLTLIIESGAKVVTVDGEIDLTTADGEFRATMLAGIARFEARRKGERQTRANAHAASLGKRTGGRRPFGYKQDGMTIEPFEAAAIASGYSDFLAGVSLAAIARDWKSKGLHTATPRYTKGYEGEPSDWSSSSVRTLLENPRYMGKRAYLGEIITEAQWPAIVDENTWQAVKAVLNSAAKRKSPTRGRYLLTGMAICGVCRSTVHSGGNARAGVPAYRCSGSLGHFARKSAPVEEFVREVMIARLSRPDAKELTASKPLDDGRNRALEAVGLRARLDAIAIEFADGHLTASQLRAASERMRESLSTVENEMAEAGRVDVLSPLIGAADIGAAWDALEMAKQRAVIALLARIVIYPPGRGTRNFDPETVGIEWLS
jgi:site-specific DNA recombinase